MNPSKSFPFTDEQLDAAGLRGEGASELVTQVIERMREHPERFNLSLFELQCMNSAVVVSPAPPTPSETPSHCPDCPIATDSAPYFISDWERTTYYRGICDDPPPELLYRSDLRDNPFPIPNNKHPHVPTSYKTVHGVFTPPLNAIWETLLLQLCQLLETRGIRFSTVGKVRFLTHSEDDWIVTRGPMVIWVMTRPGTTTAENAHDASLDVLALLKTNGVEDATVEWYEGTVERL